MARKHIRTEYSDGSVMLSNISDKNTRELISFRKVSHFLDGTAMSDVKADGFVYRKQGNEYFADTSFLATGAVSIFKFGAKGDGITDDTVAFQKAAALGGEISIPWTPAAYKISDTIPVKSGTKFLGSIRKPWLFPNLSNSQELFSINGEEDILIDLVKVSAPGQAYGSAVDINLSANVKVTNCLFDKNADQNLNGGGIRHGVYISNSEWCRVEDTWVINNRGNHGVQSYASRNIDINRCTFQNINRSGVSISQGSHDVRVTNNKVIDCMKFNDLGDGCIDVYGGTVDGVRNSNIFVENNEILDFGGNALLITSGVRIVATRDAFIRRNRIVPNDICKTFITIADRLQTEGVRLTCDNVYIEDNTMETSHDIELDAIRLSHRSGKSTYIRGNKIKAHYPIANPNVAGINAEETGLEDVWIEDNTIQFANNIPWGIISNISGHKNYTVSKNKFIGCKTSILNNIDGLKFIDNESEVYGSTAGTAGAVFTNVVALKMRGNTIRTEAGRPYIALNCDRAVITENTFSGGSYPENTGKSITCRDNKYEREGANAYEKRFIVNTNYTFQESNASYFYNVFTGNAGNLTVPADMFSTDDEIIGEVEGGNKTVVAGSGLTVRVKAGFQPIVVTNGRFSLRFKDPNNVLLTGDLLPA